MDLGSLKSLGLKILIVSSKRFRLLQSCRLRVFECLEVESVLKKRKLSNSTLNRGISWPDRPSRKAGQISYRSSNSEITDVTGISRNDRTSRAALNLRPGAIQLPLAMLRMHHLKSLFKRNNAERCAFRTHISQKSKKLANGIEHRQSLARQT
jgi:hypothetical protein